jgi:hypothetical protein
MLKKFLFLILCILCSSTLLSIPNPITDLKVIETHWRQIKLQWTVPQSVEPVVKYEIRCSTYKIISTETDWDTNSSETGYPYRVIIDTSPLQGELTTYVFTNLTNGVPYFFAIKSSTDPVGNVFSNIDTTSPRPFGIPTNNSPANGFSLSTPTNATVVISQNIIFDWDDVNDEDISYGDSLKYEVYFATYSSRLYGSTPPNITGATVVSNLTTSFLSLPAANFIDNTTYYWRVKVVDEEMSSSWSIQDDSHGKFIVNHTSDPPSVPDLFFPVNGSTVSFTGGGIFFDWGEVFDPDPQESISYSLFVSSTSSVKGFANVSSGITWSSVTISSVFGGWVENATYWYYVKAIDSTGLSSQSTTNYFFVNNTNDSPIPNILISVGTTVYLEPIVVINTLNPTFSWTETFDPDPYSKVYYQLFISSYSDLPDILNSVYYTTTPNYSTYYTLTDYTLEEETTYFWRVRIWDEVYGEFSNSTTTFWFFTNAINEPPVAATLLSPPIDSTTIYFYPKFEWQIGYDTGFNGGISSQTLVYWTGSTTTTVQLPAQTSFYIPTQPLENFSTYYWRIITYDNGEPLPVLSSESVTGKFVLFNSSPTEFAVVSPMSGTIISTSTPTIIWQQSVDPEGYEIFYKIEYSTYSDFSFYISSYGIKVTTFTFEKDLDDNTTYYFKLFSFDEQGVWTQSGGIHYFIVDYIPELPQQFDLLQPPNGTTVTKKVFTTFYWEQTFDPDPFDNVTYNIYISTEKNFNSIYFSSTNIPTNTLTLSDNVLSFNNTYFWYITAVSSRSGFRVSNSTYTLYVKNYAPLPARLFLPQDGEIITSSYVVLSWKPSDDGEDDNFFYEIHLTTTTTQPPPWSQEIVYIASQTDTQFSLNLQNNTTYNWYIVTIDTYNHSSTSVVRTFWTKFINSFPTQSTLLLPLNEEKVRLPYTFLWSTSTDNDIFDSVNYRIKISSNADLSNEIILSSVSVPWYVLNNYFLPSGTYYWQVVAYDKNFAETSSAINKFFIPEYKIILISPQDFSKISSLPEFKWTPVDPVVVTDTVTYTLIYSTDSLFNFRYQITLTETQYKLKPFLQSGVTYYWYVESQDSYSRKEFSNVFRFFTPVTQPQDPQEITISTTSLGILISWNKVEKNVDNTEMVDFVCYKLYRTLDLFSHPTLLTSTTETFYLDKEGLETEYFYIIKTLNQWNIESSGNNVIRWQKTSVAKIFTSDDKNVIITVPSNEIKNDVITVTRKILLETDNYPLVCEITSGEKKKLETFFDVSIKLPDITKKYQVQYYDGYNWQFIPSKNFSNSLNFKTQYLGTYRLTLEDITLDSLTILGCSPYKRIITPNNDGYNDEINFVYKTDFYLVGEIYDLTGKKVANMKQKDSNILYFDGKDNDGNYVLPGVYVYHITAKPLTNGLKEKYFTGTIVVKY